MKKLLTLLIVFAVFTAVLSLNMGADAKVKGKAKALAKTAALSKMKALGKSQL